MRDELERILPTELQPGMVITINNSFLCEYVKRDNSRCYFEDVDFNDERYGCLINSFSGIIVDGIGMFSFSIEVLKNSDTRIYSRALKNIDEINNEIDSLVKQVFSAIHALSITK